MPVFVIAPLLLQAADRDRLAEWRSGYDPQAKIVEPHVTMMFALDDGLETQVAQWVRTCTESAKSCAMRLTQVTVARDYENSAWYLFLLPKQIPSVLADLHRRLHSGSSLSAPDVAFDAHVTIGRFQERVLAESVGGDLNAARLGIEARIEALAVVRYDGTAIRARSLFPLGKTTA